MAKYLLLKHYRGAPAPVNNVSMDKWTPGEVEAHIAFMNDFAARLALNALTSPHVFLAGNVAAYRAHVQAAEQTLARLASALTVPARFPAEPPISGARALDLLRPSA